MLQQNGGWWTKSDGTQQAKLYMNRRVTKYLSTAVIIEAIRFSFTINNNEIERI